MADWIESEFATVAGDGFSARVVLRTDARFDWVRTHVVEVAGPHGSYLVQDLPYADSATDLARLLPAPSDDLDGAVLSAWRDHSSARDDWYLLAEAHRDGTAPVVETDRLYRLADLADGVAVEDAYRPKMRMVAIDQTHCMADGVVDVIGRVKGVYTYNAASVTHLCEVTPSYELEFQQNVCERHFPDAEEGEIDAVFAEAGYEDEHRFTSDDGGERYTYMHCRDVDGLRSEPLETNASFDVEYMLEKDDEARRRMIEEAVSEFGSNGHFDIDWFKDARPVDEIVADGERRRAVRGVEADAAPCSAYRGAVSAAREHAAAWKATWEDGERRAAYVAYHDLRSSAPSGAGDVDRWMEENHPEETAAGRAVEQASASHSTEREAAFETVHRTLGLALGAMGRHWGKEVAARLEEAPTRVPFAEVDRAFRQAAAFRKARLDGGSLAFDPEGMFTNALYRELGVAKGMPLKGKKWLAAVVERVEQPAFATVTCDRDGIESLNGILEGSATTPMCVGGDGEAARFRVTLDLRPGAYAETLAFLRHGADGIEVEGPFVVDPHFRLPGTSPMDPAVLGRPREEMDVVELAGRAAACRWHSMRPSPSAAGLAELAEGDGDELLARRPGAAPGR